MYNDLFERVIGDAPLSTVDIDGLMGRQRRLSRRRVAGAVTVAAATTAVLVAATLSIGQPGTGASQDGQRPSGVDSPFAGPIPTEPPTTAEQRLAIAMRDAVLAVAPGATLRAADGTPGFTVTHVDHEVAGTAPVTVPEFSYAGATTVTVGGHQTSLEIGVKLAGPTTEVCVLASGQCGPPNVTGPHGETGYLIGVGTMGGGAGEPAQETPTQYHLWLDRAAVDHGAVTVDLGDWPSVRTAQPTPNELPLTKDQLIQLAADPALTLYP